MSISGSTITRASLGMFLVAIFGAGQATAQTPSEVPVEVVRTGDGFPSAVVDGLATAPDGTAVMVGTRGSENPVDSAPDAVATVWHSSDGSTWNAVALPDGAGAHAVGVASNGSVVVAVGSKDETSKNAAQAFTWSSPDGAAWDTTTQTKGSRIFAVAASPEGFVAVGEWAAKCGKKRCVASPAIWTSPDGTKWAPKKLPVKGQPIAAAVRGDTTVVAVSQPQVGRPAIPSLAVKSGDAGWTTVDWPTDVTSATYEQLGGLAATEDGFLLTSQTEGIWSSSDGVDWQLLLAAPGYGPVVGGTIPAALKGGGIARPGADGIWQAEPASIVSPYAATRLIDGRIVVGGLQGNGEAPPDIVVSVIADTEPSRSINSMNSTSAGASPTP